jgi:hypothetical protein
MEKKAVVSDKAAFGQKTYGVGEARAFGDRKRKRSVPYRSLLL